MRQAQCKRSRGAFLIWILFFDSTQITLDKNRI